MRGASFATCFSAVLRNVNPCEWWSHALLKFCVCRATAQNRRTVAFGRDLKFLLHFCMVVEFQLRSHMIRGVLLSPLFFGAVLNTMKPCEWWSNVLRKFCKCRAIGEARRTVAF